MILPTSVPPERFRRAMQSLTRDEMASYLLFLFVARPPLDLLNTPTLSNFLDDREIDLIISAQRKINERVSNEYREGN